eukprot:CAMPEP_0174257356 /NCGR_PEP_ID=MMETSP0439-20130205/6506_1 /TAXON_ID=0 /ORGANISM="Stereomyxa ramosa, Strain Chinc5" /LENGTH=208 /DNA_ID=CAMNT_0015340409 /DNA_START=109 /DNA_END=735 /DNA_ORIENTATION=+
MSRVSKRAALSSTTSKHEIKLVLGGVGGVGKSAFCITYVANMWVSKYDPTIEDSHRKQVVVDDQASMLYILDTAGQEEYITMQDQWFKSGEGFILLYSITSRKSFNELDRIRTKVIRTTRYETIPIVLVGNKSDLEESRKVAKQEGEQKAQVWKCPFFETSAKLHVGVDDAFAEAVRLVRKFRIANGTVEEEKPKSLKKKGKHKCVVM